jgi:sialic acid synthase SpsE
MNSKTFIIAEAGVNHNGSPELARKLVDVEVEAGGRNPKSKIHICQALCPLLAPLNAFAFLFNWALSSQESYLEF